MAFLAHPPALSVPFRSSLLHHRFFLSSITPPLLLRGPSVPSLSSWCLQCRHPASSLGSACVADTSSEPIYHKNKIDAASSSAVKSPAPISWGIIWGLLCQHKLRILVSLVSLIGCTACTLSIPIYSGRIFEVLIGRRSSSLRDVIGKIAVLYALEPVFTIIFVSNLNAMWEKVMSNLKAQIFQRILIQKMEFFDRFEVGELTALLTSDLGSLKNILTGNISRYRGLRAIFELVGTICILFTLSPQLAPLVGILILTVSVLAAVYKRSTVLVYKDHGNTQVFTADCVNETFSAIRTVRSYAGEKQQMSLFGNLIIAHQDSGVKIGTFKSINESLTRIAVYISLLALYSVGGSKVKAGEMTTGTVISFIRYNYSLTFAVQGVVNTFEDLLGGFAAFKRINSVISEAETDEALAYGLEKDIKCQEAHDKSFESLVINGYHKHEHNNAHCMSTPISTSSLGCLARSGDICLEDVHFSYPLRPDVEVLNSLDLTLKSGTVTALVGPSGAGKSTIVQLLARFYEPTKGCITVAGEDVRTFDKSEWARVVSVVDQEPVLFSASVSENIVYGLPDEYIPMDDVIKAAKAANAHDIIISLPQGYDTLLGERGSLLSRIAIARALLKNAPILILDEVTSALDAVSERVVQQALNHLMKGRTTLVITHRLSAVQNAHQIALCSQGRITEIGTYLELLRKKGQCASPGDAQRLTFE